MCTILDAHPDVAMSYELYPDLLNLDDPSPAFLRKILRRLRWPFVTLKMLGAWIGNEPFRTFLRRLPQGGLDKADFVRLLQAHVDAGMSFGTSEERLRFVERCCVLKMRRAGKTRWGLKGTSRFDEYVAVWPDAQIINMIRDGRDVLASQLKTGTFEKDPVRCGHGWVRTIEAFRKFAARHPAQAHPVIYEQLVSDPEGTVRALCAEMGLAFKPEMLRYHEQKLTFYNTRHISRDRVATPIDSRSVGRWRRDVTPEELAAFYSVARDMLVAYGYLDDKAPEHTGI